MNHSVKQLVDDFLAWYAGRGQGLKAFFVCRRKPQYLLGWV